MVAATFARLDVDHARAAASVFGLHDGRQRLTDLRVVFAVFCARDAPTVRLEPIARCAVNNFAVRAMVDAVIVPVEQVHEVVETQPVRRVLDFMVRACGVTTFALHGKHARLPRTCVLERQGFAHRCRRAVTRRPGVELEEERLALHLRVTGQPLVAAQIEQVFKDQLALGGVRNEEARVLGQRMPRTQGFVVDRQHGVHGRRAVTRDQHKAIAEGEFGPADVEAHARAKRGRDEQRHFGTRAARMSRLAQVEHQVDALVDQVTDLLVVREMLRPVREIHACGCRLHRLGGAKPGVSAAVYRQLC